MQYELYSRTNQRILEGAVIGVSFYTAFLIHFEGAIPPYREYQFWTLLITVIAGQLLTILLFGLNRSQWRHIGFRYAWTLGRLCFSFPTFLLLLRFGSPTLVWVTNTTT